MDSDEPTTACVPRPAAQGDNKTMNNLKNLVGKAGFDRITAGTCRLLRCMALALALLAPTGARAAVLSIYLNSLGQWTSYSGDLRSALAGDLPTGYRYYYLGGFQTNLFRCPSDKFVLEMDSQKWKGQVAYRFNYTLSGTYPRISVASWGMASIIPLVEPARLFLANMIRNPAEKIMLAEEPTRAEIETLGLGRGGDGGGTSAWDWGHGDTVTTRHSGRGSVAHADGHVQVVSTNNWRDPRHYELMFAD
jgi:prepilin-type processing-associated H-X9-DG protein